MVALKKKVIGKKSYYYLEHSFRQYGKIRKCERYLGKEIPTNIEQSKEEVLQQVYQEQWFKKFNVIKESFSRENSKTPKSAQKKEMENFAIKFTYNTNKIEGSILSLKETATLLEKGITPSHRPIEDVKEAEAHKEVFYDMLTGTREVSLDTILHWHRMLFQYTKKDIAGRIRNHQVTISGSKFEPPLPIEIDMLLREFFEWYRVKSNKHHPVQLAALVHLRLVTIHPFSDGNGRISRIFINYVLNKKGFPMLIIPYSQRNSYYNALERSQLKKDESIFTLWFFKRYLREYHKYIK